VTFYETKKRHAQEDSINLHTHRRENCKSKPHLLKAHLTTPLVAQHGKIISEQRIGRNVEGSDRGLT
jgi:hypothetical protein